MRDAALGAPPGIAEEGVSWRDGLRLWASQQHRLYLQRPWLARLPVSGPPARPHAIVWMDTALGMLRATGLSWTEKVGVMSVLGGYVRQAALQTQDLAHGRAEGIDRAEAERDYGRALVTLVDPARLRLELILDGTSAAIHRADAGARPTVES
jgi:hypothetical protein